MVPFFFWRPTVLALPPGSWRRVLSLFLLLCRRLVRRLWRSLCSLLLCSCLWLHWRRAWRCSDRARSRCCGRGRRGHWQDCENGPLVFWHLWEKIYTHVSSCWWCICHSVGVCSCSRLPFPWQESAYLFRQSFPCGRRFPSPFLSFPLPVFCAGQIGASGRLLLRCGCLRLQRRWGWRIIKKELASSQRRRGRRGSWSGGLTRWQDRLW